MVKARRFWMGVVLVALCAARANALERPTVKDLEDEIRQSELVIRGTVSQIRWEGFPGHAFSQDVILRIAKRYQGEFARAEIPLFLNLPEWVHPAHLGRPSLAANVGDQLIVPVKAMKIVTMPPEAAARGEPDHYYTTPSFYVIRDGAVVGSPYPLSEELAKHRELADFERLIERIVALPPKQLDRYVPGKVLFFDDFDDGSYAGWTFLTGARGDETMIESFYGEKWVGPGLRWKNKYPEDKRGSWGELTRDENTGNYEGVLDGAQLQIGVYDGRLRLRCSRLWHHVTAVAGDPS